MQRGNEVTDSHPSGQAKKPVLSQKPSCTKKSKLCTVISMEGMADMTVGYASACSCFWAELAVLWIYFMLLLK